MNYFFSFSLTHSQESLEIIQIQENSSIAQGNSAKMLRILRKTTASMARTSGSSPAERYDAFDDDLSTWEFVEPSLSEDEDLYSFDGDDTVCEGGSVSGDGPESKPVRGGDGEESRDVVTAEDVIAIQSLSVSPPMTLPVEMTRNHVYHDDGDACDDDDDDVDDYDVDDELVPWKLKDRFGKQRIRKMGKRGGPNPNKSKRLPFYYNKPGCLYGKHGFGVQHSFI